MDGENMNSDLRVASFSYYLDSAEESFVQKLTKISDAPSTICSPKKTPCLDNLGRSTKTTFEISLFGADKYSTCHEGISKYAHETDTCLRQYVSEQYFRPKTPSICSETSSWNSQSMSLPDPHRKLKKARNSVEVFGSTMTKKEDIMVNLERKLSMLTWDAIPKTPNIRPPSLRNITRSDDMTSDGSSDFFEIDNISTDKCPVLSKQEPYALSKAKDLCTKISRSRGLLGCKSYKAVRVAENNSSDKAKGCNMYPSTKNGPSKLQPAGKYHYTS